MASLAPVGGDGAPEPTCYFCNRRAAGPCAFCRRLVCGRDDCSVVVKERGLELVVLCADCARSRPVLARSPLAPLGLLVVGALLVILSASSGSTSVVAGLGCVAGGVVALLGLGAWVSRWQWRSRLSRARGGSRPERGS